MQLIIRGEIMKKTLLIILFSSIIISCSKQFKTSDSIATEQSSNAQSHVASSVLAKLSGTWSSPCTKISTQASFLTSLTFTSTTMQTATNYYSDTGCKTVTNRMIQNSNFNLETTDEANQAKNKINFYVTSNFFHPVDSAIVQQYNDEKFCGIDSWLPNIARQVDGKTCRTMNIVNNYMIYQIISIDSAGTSSSLRLGLIDSSHDALSRAKTPESYSLVIYTKQ